MLRLRSKQNLPQKIYQERSLTVMFRTSLKGFKKSEVNNYIITMHREFAEEKEALEEELSSKNSALQDAVELLSEKDTIINKLNVRLSDIPSLTEKNEKLTDENKRLNEQITYLNSRIEELTGEVSRLTLRAESAEKFANELQLKEAKKVVCEDVIKDLPNGKGETSTYTDSSTEKKLVNEKEESFLARFKRLFV